MKRIFILCLLAAGCGDEAVRNMGDDFGGIPDCLEDLDCGADEICNAGDCVVDPERAAPVKDPACEPPIEIAVNAIEWFDADGEPVELQLDNLLVRSIVLRTPVSIYSGLHYGDSLPDGPILVENGISFLFEMPGEVWMCVFDAGDFAPGVGMVTCPTKLDSATPVQGPTTQTTVITYENRSSPSGDFCVECPEEAVFRLIDGEWMCAPPDCKTDEDCRGDAVCVINGALGPDYNYCFA